MTAWGWAGLALAWALSLYVAWRMAVEYGHERYWQGREDQKSSSYEAGTRAAAAATRATIADAVSLLPSLRCGGGHADHVKRSDVQRIIAEPTP